MNSYNFSNSVSEPTHHQGASSTLIDIVFANNKDIDRTTVFPCPFSNHSFAVCQANFSSAALTKSSVVGRILNEKNLIEIRKILASENHRFDSIDLFDVNDKFFAFTKAIMSVVDEVAPLKKFRLKKSNAIPWIDSELLELIAAKDHLHKAAVNSGTSRDSTEWKAFITARNIYKSSMRKKMTIFFHNKTSSYFKSSKKFWSFYKSVVKTKKGSSDKPINNLKSDDGSLVSENKLIVDQFNKFFGNFKLPSQINDSDSKNYVSEIFRKLKDENILKCPEKQFSFHLTNDNEVLKYIKLLSPSSSPGNCDISVKILKACCFEIAPALVKIFNSCILSTAIANDWKSAIISPLYKGKGNIDECDNYRGISILQPIIKVFERVLAAQVVSYFEKNGLFCSAQHGFRSNHSCETALQCILDDWKTFLFKREIVFSLFIDFKKAFDLINRELLFLKLFHYGFDNNSLNLFKDYFTDRNQRTRIGSDISEPLSMKSVFLKVQCWDLCSF
jgi:hypothetical protein